jgi:hypothetical protein
MTVENINVVDPDSLMAAADLLDLRESYDAYLMRLADECDAESAISPDDADEPADPSDGLYLMATLAPSDDPEPPAPAAPALRPLPPVPCSECRGFGCVAKIPTTAFSGQPCWFCGGTGAGPFGNATPSTPVSDRVARLRRIGQTGGMTTFLRYGSNFYRRIGRAGYQATAKAHGEQYARDLLRAKGWTPRQPDLLGDLRIGRELAELDRAA